MRANVMNRKNPHMRDIDRFRDAAEAAVDGVNVECHTSIHRANTGTVYVTVSLCDMRDGGFEGERVYRFASHAEAHTSHDYSVHSGGSAKASQPLEPGYDGYTKDAIADVKRWIAQNI